MHTLENHAVESSQHCCTVPTCLVEDRKVSSFHKHPTLTIRVPLRTRLFYCGSGSHQWTPSSPHYDTRAWKEAHTSLENTSSWSNIPFPVRTLDARADVCFRPRSLPPTAAVFSTVAVLDLRIVRLYVRTEMKNTSYCIVCLVITRIMLIISTYCVQAQLGANIPHFAFPLTLTPCDRRQTLRPFQQWYIRPFLINPRSLRHRRPRRR